EGGVIREIYVREGDIVEQGQLSVYSDETAPRAELRRLFLRRMRLTAMDARLQAEMREANDIAFPDELNQASNEPEVKEISESQRSTFTARRNNMNSDIAGINEGINASNERIQGSRVQLDGVRRQIKVIEEEIEAKEYLSKTGSVRKPEVSLSQRAQANLEGEV
ncbi:hypothetical protein OY671_011282, partial [Metschnikowia pulcherrima]